MDADNVHSIATAESGDAYEAAFTGSRPASAGLDTVCVATSSTVDSSVWL